VVQAALVGGSEVIETDWETEGYVYTEMNPHLLDRLLDKNSYLIDKWNRMLVWHRAQRNWRNTIFVLAEAAAIMKDTGPATKAKAAATDTPKVIDARAYLDIAEAQLHVCERRLHSLEKEAINLALRNKLLGALWNNGGGSY
jgi:hypothetical protein